MQFSLRQYDTELMLFELTSEPLAGFRCRVLKVVQEHRHLLPLGMSVDEAGVMSWLKSRVIPQNREFVDRILSVYGLSHNNILCIIQLCKGLSLNDCYWVTEPEFTGRFADYNLYENGFYQALSLLAYTGYGSVRPSGFSSSPEFTTQGMLRKGWRRREGRILLYKGGTSGGVNTGYEPYSEFYAAQVAARMGIRHIPYTLSQWKGSLCSVCELFTNLETSFVPLWRLCRTRSLKEVAEYLRRLGAEYFEPFCDMLIFDAVICNTDRHLNNFGLLVDNASNLPYAFAPLFDHGMSLFNQAMPEDFANLPAYAQSRLSAFDVPFEEIVRAFVTRRQREQLRQLQEFRFERHRRYNLSAPRLRALEQFIRQRSGQMLAWT